MRADIRDGSSVRDFRATAAISAGDKLDKLRHSVNYTTIAENDGRTGIHCSHPVGHTGLPESLLVCARLLGPTVLRAPGED